MIPLRKRFTAGLTALCLRLGTHLMAQPRAAADPADCTPTGTASMFAYSDSHGRLANTAALLTPVEKAHASQRDANVALIGSGDDIGGFTFESMADDDNPTLKVMAAVGLSARTAGNHGFDKGWVDLAGRMNPAAPGVDQLGANVCLKGARQVASPLKAYTTFKVGELDVAVIDAVTGDLPSLVPPTGISDLTIGDPANAMNDIVSQLPEGIDLVIASIHEGAPNGNDTGDDQAIASPNFRKMWTGIDPRIHMVLGGHTHQTYSWTNDKGQLLTQAGSYAVALNELKAGVTGDGALYGISNTTTKIDARTFDTSLSRIREITDIVPAAVTKADEIGTQVIGQASEATSTSTGNSDIRDVEPPMSNMVVQIFQEVLGGDDPYFIGVQSPGGTRDSLDSGEVTYKEVALALPFANTLMAIRLTGAQFKTVLEQQWQRNDKGGIPSCPFPHLGLSSNVSYACSESRPEGDQIISVFVGDSPLDSERLYTVGPTSFLIVGGDNFREFAKGTRTRDTGRVDPEAWTDWVKARQTLSPSYVKHGLSLVDAPTGINRNGGTAAFSFDVPSGDAEVREGVDFLLDEAAGASPKDPAKVSPALANNGVEVFLGGTSVSNRTVTDGRARVDVTLPGGCSAPTGTQALTFKFTPSGTLAHRQVNIIGDDSSCTPAPPKPNPAGTPSPAPVRPGLSRTGS